MPCSLYFLGILIAHESYSGYSRANYENKNRKHLYSHGIFLQVCVVQFLLCSPFLESCACDAVYVYQTVVQSTF